MQTGQNYSHVWTGLHLASVHINTPMGSAKKLDAFVENITQVIQETMVVHIPLAKLSPFVKHWWTKELTCLWCSYAKFAERNSLSGTQLLGWPPELNQTRHTTCIYQCYDTQTICTGISGASPNVWWKQDTYSTEEEKCTLVRVTLQQYHSYYQRYSRWMGWWDLNTQPH